jgi:hypothetical protein
MNLMCAGSSTLKKINKGHFYAMPPELENAGLI